MVLAASGTEGFLARHLRNRLTWERLAGLQVRSLLATLVAFVLLLMLSVTTPMATGDGVHDSVLLHPLLSHTHVVSGRLVTHDQLANASSATQERPGRGPAIGSEAGASAATSGLAISPTVPLHDLRLGIAHYLSYPQTNEAQPRGLVTAPPDPPPTFGA